jgi:hypothetical protein
VPNEIVSLYCPRIYTSPLGPVAISNPESSVLLPAEDAHSHARCDVELLEERGDASRLLGGDSRVSDSLPDIFDSITIPSCILSADIEAERRDERKTAAMIIGGNRLLMPMAWCLLN